MPRKSGPKLTPPSSEAHSSEVGYKRPPVANQFKKGVSGNPRGRSKGARNKRPALHEERLKGIILDEAYRTIKVNEGAKQLTLSIAQAVVRALAVNAARGQLRSAQAFMALVSGTEQANKAQYAEYLEAAMTYKADWENELERRRQSGETGPEPLPHPDDIVINMQTVAIAIRGPMSKEDKAKWDRAWDRVEACDQSIAECKADLRNPKMRKYHTFIRDEHDHEQRIRKIITDAVGEPRRR